MRRSRRAHERRRKRGPVRLWIGAIVVLVSIAGLGCSSTHVIRGRLLPGADFQPSGELRVGAAETDITPIPGFPMGGHGIAARTSRGVWTRLKARAIYLEDPNGEAVVLLACDLWAMPAGLVDRAVEIVQSAALKPRLGRDRFIVAATHTHQSPGNFSSSDAYNSFGSNRVGFDAALFEFLAQGIASAAVDAQRAARPAIASFGESAEPRLMRNRSPVPFALDPEARTSTDGRLDPGRRVDPTIQVLTFREKERSQRLIALGAFVSVHPTAMGHETEVYQADLFGVASRMVAWAEENSERQPVVAIFNGAEGDVAADADPEHRDRAEAERLGSLLAAGIREAMAGARPIGGDLSVRAARARIAGSCFDELPSGERRCTARRGLPGAATLGGAQDGQTILHGLVWQEGIRATRWGWQGSKQPAFDLLDLLGLDVAGMLHLGNPNVTAMLESGQRLPEVAPVSLVRFGALSIVSLPGELTTVMGARVREAVASASGHTGPVLLVGLAHEYLSYFATPEEYEAQWYEGSSTLFGPAAGPFLSHLAAELSHSPPSAETESRYGYEVHEGGPFGLDDTGSTPYFADDGLGNLLVDFQTHQPIRDVRRFCWRTPRAPWPPAATDEEPVPRVEIEHQSADGRWVPLVLDGRPQTDEGLDLVTVLHDREDRDGPVTYCTFWHPPAPAFAPLEVRLRVRGAGGDVEYPGALDSTAEDHARPLPRR